MNILNNPVNEMAIVQEALNNQVPVYLNFYDLIDYPLKQIVSISNEWINVNVIANGVITEMGLRTNGNYYRFIIEN